MSVPYDLHPTPYTLHPTPYTLHPTPYTLNPEPYTLHPTIAPSVRCLFLDDDRGVALALVEGVERLHHIPPTPSLSSQSRGKSSNLHRTGYEYRSFSLSLSLFRERETHTLRLHDRIKSSLTL